jgi:hypothetical protein
MTMRNRSLIDHIFHMVIWGKGSQWDTVYIEDVCMMYMWASQIE